MILKKSNMKTFLIIPPPCGHINDTFFPNEEFWSKTLGNDRQTSFNSRART